MALQVIVGAGPVGAGVARLLAARGDRVRIVTRSGSGPEGPAIERVAADATDVEALTALVEGAATLFNCASPQYHRWLTDWPPLAAAILTAAERTGATLVTQSNLYGYGAVSGPLTEETPLAATHPKLRLRAHLWRSALAAHRAGRARATEVRASDYIQANSVFALAVAKPLLSGKRAVVPAALDVPHSWTSINDVAMLLVTVASDERAWGRAWHAPSQPPVTLRELATRFTAEAGLPLPQLTSIPAPLVWAAGLFSPLMHELRTTRYQFDRPFIMDSTAATETFGLRPEPLDITLRDTVRRLRGGAPAA